MQGNSQSGGIGAELIHGELEAFDRLAGGAIVKYAYVNSVDTAVVAAPAILYGIILIAAGTMAGVYDNASAASGNLMIPSSTATFTYNGMGVLCNNGIFCDWTSGTWLVLYAD